MSLDVPGALTRAQALETVAAIAAAQRSDGCIPWHPGGMSDPWNIVEAAMALDAGGRHAEAKAAYRWLVRRQRGDGAWPAACLDGRIVDMTLDSNFSSYIATGGWHHYLATGDAAFLAELWPPVRAAIEFALALQMPSGAISWARDDAYRPWPGALLTSSSCIHLSLASALAIAQILGHQELEWELALAELASAVSREGADFESKDRFSMDWYYPVLGGVVRGSAGRDRMAERWDDFVIEGRGARCVLDRPWVTAGETCELVLALDAVGLTAEARELFACVQHLRAGSALYWTGATWPGGAIWPREQTTWSAGAVILAADALSDDSATARLFRDAAGTKRLETLEVPDPL